MYELILLLFETLNIPRLVNALWELFIDAIYYIANFVLDGLAQILSLINLICPDIPKIQVPALINNYAGYISWIVPFDFVALVIALMIQCTMAYIMISWMLRWAKVIK